MASTGIEVTAALPKEAFVLPAHYEDDVDSVLIPHGLIINRIDKIAQDIAKDYQGPIVACCVLKGASVFYADLMNALRKTRTSDGASVQFSYEFARVKSYHNTESTGQVHISLSEEELQAYRNKHLLIVEDIIDTGITMVALLDRLKKYEPASVKVVSMLVKNTKKSNGYEPDYWGFRIPNKFVIGYGLDYNEVFREMEHICIISERGIQRYKQ
ncbi:hypoxanthine phosphoribosyltransferase 1 [Entophlyctis luteolus]|nr:hypoxanthine phosphoribosyltransferase 1 [Entophlyctis luteolus]KAJ3356306.1 hypoxanthine phosphoribosyltransferase 1 [Entophlyctis luteolus]KAJ3393050.1 hypoxanthine phosphoribosyltransferase 1 [Entophlyctis sp. JEL0112]